MKKNFWLAALLCSAAATPVYAQVDSADEAGDGDIIVTATKRETSLQSTPLAITSLSGSALADRQITDLESLSAALPNVGFNRFLGQGRVTIRGLGHDASVPTMEGRVAFHIDGVYVSRNSVTLSAMFDIDRIEAVRGPQGTLYGRNATAGAINLIPKKPTRELDGYATIGLGNYDLINGEFALGGPLSSTVSARAAVSLTSRGGFGTNLQSGRDIDNVREGSGRFSLRWEPSGGTDILLTADYHVEDDRNYQQHYNGTAAGSGTAPTAMAMLYGGVVASNPRDSNSERDGSNYRRNFGLALNVSTELSDSWTFKSITGYRYSFYDWNTDMDGTQIALAPYGQQERSRQYSQEFQLQYESDRVSAVFGAFGFKEDTFGRVYILLQNVAAPPSFLTQGYRVEGDLKTKAGAIFGEATVKLTDRLSAVVGVRYSGEKKEISDSYQLRRVDPYTAPVNGPYDPRMALIPSAGWPRTDKKSWDSITPKAGLSFQATDNLFLFANYGRGFKSGGFTPGILQAAFNPETVDSFEIGERATLFDRRLTLNLTGFHYQYKDMQVNKLAGTTIIVENAASAKINGIELEANLKPADGWQIDLSGSWLDTEFGEYIGLGNINNKGNRLPMTSKWQGLAALQKRFDISPDMKATLRGEVEFRSGLFYNEQNLPRLAGEGRAKLNLFANFELPQYDLKVGLYVRNVTNKFVYANVRVGSPLYGSPYTAVLEAPRTFGVNITRFFQ